MTLPSLRRTGRSRLRRAVAAAGAVAIGAGPCLVSAGPVLAAATCKVVYTKQNEWSGGFTANVGITNQGASLTSWKLDFDFPHAGQKVTNLWNGKVTQTGQHVTATNETWNGNVGSGATVSLGFNGVFTTANPEPTAFKLNGAACNDTVPAPTVQITAPARNARFTAPATIPITATAAAPAGGQISRVEFFHDGLLLGTDPTAPYAYDWTGVPAQTAAYRVQAIAYDAAGTPSEPAEVPVFVDPSTGPSVLTDASAVTMTPGGTASFTVTLSKQPSAQTVVTVDRTAGATGISATPATLTFTSATWNVAQTVTVSATAATAANSSATITLAGTAVSPTNVTATVIPADGGTDSRFIQLYNMIKNPSNGYFSPEGVPYHSVETLIDEAPDHGHETTSEAFSYWLWLEAEHGQVSGDWAPFNKAWATMEKYIIPSTADQPTNANYNPAKPATYAAEYPQPSQYPSPLDGGVPVGSDPLAAELKSTYGTSDIYGMHWLLDVDNTYGYGRCGDGTTRVAYINTFQRGTQESTWETVPQPSCDTFRFGGPNGYLDLFTKDSSYAKQWKYTNAPDADARVVQVAYWAHTWATAQDKASQISTAVANAAKMGDYLRYSMFDKYFKNHGCHSTSCPAGSGKSSSNYLMSWYYAWGGAYDTSAGWAWRIGSSHNHGGYQNPMAAWALSNVSALTPKSATGKSDWQISLNRQLEFYQWLQSSEGAIAGGATNSWNGNYSTPPAGTPTFYGLAYEPHPVYSDPPSNQWFGFQAWTMERVAEYYYVTGDLKAKSLLDRWAAWAMSKTTVGADGAYRIPSTLTWTGTPATWNPSAPAANTGLHVSVVDYTNDVGVAGSYAKVLMYYAAKSGNTAAKNMAKGLLDGVWAHRDAKGVSVSETRRDYDRFDDVYNAATGQGLYIPPGWTGTMPNGDVIKPGASFLDIRSFYRNDPDFPKVDAYLKGGPAPVFNYHRFWAQVDVATGYADYARLFPNG